MGKIRVSLVFMLKLFFALMLLLGFRNALYAVKNIPPGVRLPTGGDRYRIDIPPFIWTTNAQGVYTASPTVYTQRVEVIREPTDSTFLAGRMSWRRMQNAHVVDTRVYQKDMTTPIPLGVSVPGMWGASSTNGVYYVVIKPKIDPGPKAKSIAVELTFNLQSHLKHVVYISFESKRAGTTSPPPSPPSLYIRAG